MVLVGSDELSHDFEKEETFKCRHNVEESVRALLPASFDDNPVWVDPERSQVNVQVRRHQAQESHKRVEYQELGAQMVDDESILLTAE